MLDLTIKTENQNVKWAFELFIDNYKDNIAQFLNNVIKGETGQPVDSYINKDEDGTITIHQTAPDKGYVLAEVATDKVEFTKYLPLAVGTKYVVFDGNSLSLFVKEEDGKPDMKVGRFTNLNDVVNQINSDSVTTTIETLRAAEKNALKELKKVERKAKLKKLAANVTNE